MANLPPIPTALLDYSKILIDSTSSFFPSLQFSSTNSPGSKFSILLQRITYMIFLPVAYDVMPSFLMK